MDNVHRCRRLAVGLAVTLGLLVIAIPLAAWEQVWQAHGGPASAPTLFYTVLAATCLAAAVVALLYLSARNALSKSIADAKGSDT